MTTKTLTEARVSKVVNAMYLYSEALNDQYARRVKRQAMKIAELQRLFAFRRGGFPTLGTVKNALRYARANMH